MTAIATNAGSSERLHPLVQMIVAELDTCDHDLAFPEERFEYWCKRLWTRHPRNASAELYDQLGRLAFRLAAYECLAALQLFALATLGLDAVWAAQLAKTDAFLASDVARRTYSLGHAMAASAVKPVTNKAAPIPVRHANDTSGALTAPRPQLGVHAGPRSRAL